MKLLKRIKMYNRIRYMFSIPTRRINPHKPVENKTSRLPETDYVGMGNFSRFGNPPK